MSTTNLLSKIRMTRLKAIPTAQGNVAWSGTLTRDGKPWAIVSNAGDGGCNDYRAVGDRAFLAIDDVEEAARAATGMRFEAFDALTACMENGQTAASVVATVRATYGTD